MKNSEKNNVTKDSLLFIDDVTGVYNRRYLGVMKKEVEKLREMNIP
jgi:PleD family two-component response regulator